VKLSFLRLPAAEQKLYFEQAAQQRGLSPVILEKDFWVSWMLGVLFGSQFRDVLVFKGGTSLSKVFGVIGRFSEDIDLSLAPEFLGIAESDVDSATSRNQRTHWMEKLQAECAAKVRDTVAPAIEQMLIDALGPRPDGQSWLEFEIDATTHSPVLLFHYPTTQRTGFAYLKRSVKLEFGSLTDQRPTGRHAVRPWIAEDFAQAFGDWACEAVTLELERSFWEKATILHVECHRPADKPTPDRFSRHYADTAALANLPVVTAALGDHELRERVVGWKSRFFGSAWARYDLARPGSFKLVPSKARVRALRIDYQAMRDMYLSEPLDFDQILATLAELENKINAEGKAPT
jgi:hypothetical protein